LKKVFPIEFAFGGKATGDSSVTELVLLKSSSLFAYGKTCPRL
jgi:hypothetical protein